MINETTGKPLFDTIVPTMLVAAAVSCCCGGNCAGALRIYVHTVFTGAYLQFHLYAGCDQTGIQAGNARKETGIRYAVIYRVLYSNIGSDRDF